MVRATIFVMLLLATAAVGQEKEPAPPAPENQNPPSDNPAQAESPVDRGKYLVHHVAMCVMCHTPKTNEGKLITAQLLRGAPMPVESPYPRQPWAFRAPAIA